MLLAESKGIRRNLSVVESWLWLPFQREVEGAPVLDILPIQMAATKLTRGAELRQMGRRAVLC